MSVNLFLFLIKHFESEAAPTWPTEYTDYLYH